MSLNDFQRNWQCKARENCKQIMSILLKNTPISVEIKDVSFIFLVLSRISVETHEFYPNFSLVKNQFPEPTDQFKRYFQVTNWFFCPKIHFGTSTLHFNFIFTVDHNHFDMTNRLMTSVNFHWPCKRCVFGFFAFNFQTQIAIKKFI